MINMNFEWTAGIITTHYFILQVVIQILDISQLTTGYGYVLMFEAVGTLIGGPVAGKVDSYFI